MAKFKFKLQPLLNVKLQQEDNLKNELGKAVRKYEDEKELLLQLEDEKERYINELNGNSEQRITVDKIRKYTVYISFLSDKIKLQKDHVNKALEYVDKVREELVKTLKERQILEKFKEKRYAQFLREQLKEEQKINDEITSYRYSEKDNEGN
jgi:flagellar FliJ protein